MNKNKEDEILQNKIEIETMFKNEVNDFELMSKLRQKYDRIDILQSIVILSLGRNKYQLDIKTKNITKVTIFDEEQNKFVEINY